MTSLVTRYFNVEQINSSIRRIREGQSTMEHRTSTATLNLIRNYFHIDKFAITPEQTQDITNKKPDFAIERYTPNTFAAPEYVIHCYVEVKSIVNSNFPSILQQLDSTMCAAIDHFGNQVSGSFSSFMIAMKGTKLAFYHYHTFASLLDEHGILNYNGFIPVNFEIPRESILSFNKDGIFSAHVADSYAAKMVHITTNSTILQQLGAIGTNDIPHPHILDLDNINHREQIHQIFVYISQTNPNELLHVR